MIGAALRALLAGIVDYAGLFPPAGLDMRAAVGNFARYLASEDAWALGRFVVPAPRLDEFVEARVSLPSRGTSAAEWRLSAVLASDVAAQLDLVRRFNRTHAALATVDVVEVRLDAAAAVAAAAPLARGLDLFAEIPVQEDPLELLRAIRDAGARAKIRMGGVTAAAFPSAPVVARFLRRCHELEIAFKATAGLHHPVRGSYPLTYEPDAARATMYGFLNLLIAATLADGGAAEDELVRVLESSDTAAVRVDGETMSFAGARVSAGDLRGVRERFAISLGSCSFREPMDEMRAAGLL